MTSHRAGAAPPPVREGIKMVRVEGESKQTAEARIVAAKLTALLDQR